MMLYIMRAKHLMCLLFNFFLLYYIMFLGGKTLKIFLLYMNTFGNFLTPKFLILKLLLSDESSDLVTYFQIVWDICL